MSFIIMSKGNMLQGQARGKVGDLVFYVRDGGQQTRVRNRQPSNPRTKSQMFQRVKLASVVGFYKRQASFFRFALKKSQKESYYNAFVRYNLNLSPYLTKEAAAAGVSVPAPYIIADGDMPRVSINYAMQSSSNKLSIGTSIPSSYDTWGDMRRGMNLMMGDMVTVVVFNAPDDEYMPTNRMVSQHVFDNESDNLPIGYDMAGTTWRPVDGKREILVDGGYFGVDEFFATGSAVILSRNQGSVDCSFAQLFLDETAEGNYQERRTTEAHEAAAASYGVEKNAILDPKQFEGNYVDQIKLFSDTALTTPVSIISGAKGSEKTLYYNREVWSRVSDSTFESLGGNSVVGEVSAPDDENTVYITIKSSASGTEVIRIKYLDANNNLVAETLLTVSVTA